MGGRSRVKRKTVQNDDGWTVITHGLANISMKKGDEQSAGSMPSTVIGLTLEVLKKDFVARKLRWENTKCARQIDRVLQTREWEVTQAVCIGIGSFSRDWEHRHRCLWQLVLFAHVVEKLQKPDRQIKIYAQDPAFTELDQAFLETLNIEVTTTLEKHISSTSFVFSPFVDWHILLPIFIRETKPEFYVGNEILDDYTVYAQSEDKKEKLEQCNNLGRLFLESMETNKLVEFDLHAHALNGMVIYYNTTTKEKDDSIDAPS